MKLNYYIPQWYQNQGKINERPKKEKKNPIKSEYKEAVRHVNFFASPCCEAAVPSHANNFLISPAIHRYTYPHKKMWIDGHLEDGLSMEILWREIRDLRWIIHLLTNGWSCVFLFSLPGLLLPRPPCYSSNFENGLAAVITANFLLKAFWALLLTRNSCFVLKKIGLYIQPIVKAMEIFRS